MILFLKFKSYFSFSFLPPEVLSNSFCSLSSHNLFLEDIFSVSQVNLHWLFKNTAQCPSPTNWLCATKGSLSALVLGRFCTETVSGFSAVFMCPFPVSYTYYTVSTAALGGTFEATATQGIDTLGFSELGITHLRYPWILASQAIFLVALSQPTVGVSQRTWKWFLTLKFLVRPSKYYKTLVRIIWRTAIGRLGLNPTPQSKVKGMIWEASYSVV